MQKMEKSSFIRVQSLWHLHQLDIKTYSFAALVRFCAWEANIAYTFLYKLLAANKPVLLVASFAWTA